MVVRRGPVLFRRPARGTIGPGKTAKPLVSRRIKKGWLQRPITEKVIVIPILHPGVGRAGRECLL